MRLVLRLITTLALLVAARPALADDSALNKEGYWTVGRGDLTSSLCVASIAYDGGLFMLQAVDGQAGFAVAPKKKLGKAKGGVLATDKVRFEYAADVDDGVLYSADPLKPEALGALREAEDLVVTLDGKTLVDAHTAGTGVAGAVDAVLACSRGESGWWGKGVVKPGGSASASAEPAAKDPPRNKEGFWYIVADDKDALCTAVVPVQDVGAFVVAASDGQLGIGVRGQKPYRKASKGRLEIDGLASDFTPGFDDANNYVYSEESLDSQSAFALRRARTVTIKLDGRVILDAALEGSGHAQVLADAAACARGDSGWWGKGAPQK